MEEDFKGVKEKASKCATEESEGTSELREK